MRPEAYRFFHHSKLVRCLIILILFLGTGLPAAADTSQPVFLPLTFKSWNFGPGNINGRITDAAIQDPNLNGVAGVQVCYETTCVTTDAHGAYALNNIPSGSRQIKTTIADGSYLPQTGHVLVIGKQTVILNIVISKQLDKNILYRFIVTWRPEPTWPPDNWNNDLDSQLWLIAPLEPNSFHIDPYIYRGDCTVYPLACIMVDATKGSGPETIDFRELQLSTTYYFGVLNYNDGQPGVPPITESMAMIQIYDTNGLTQTLNVPTSGAGNFWYAFMIDTSKQFIIKNCITTFPGYGLDPPQCP
jgi:hypothetical protein